jgi:hypothetical protein
LQIGECPRDARCHSGVWRQQLILIAQPGWVGTMEKTIKRRTMDSSL